jgi:hypothetical protein
VNPKRRLLSCTLGGADPWYSKSFTVRGDKPVSAANSFSVSTAQSGSDLSLSSLVISVARLLLLQQRNRVLWQDWDALARVMSFLLSATKRRHIGIARIGAIAAPRIHRCRGNEAALH